MRCAGGRALEPIGLMTAAALCTLPLLTFFSITTARATPMLTVLTSMVAPPIARTVPPDATRARPSAARAMLLLPGNLLCSGARKTHYDQFLLPKCVETFRIRADEVSDSAWRVQ